MLFHFITYVIVDSEAVSCERTVAFARAQISQHICCGAGRACRGDGEDAAVYSKWKFYPTNQVLRDSMQCHKTYHSTLEWGCQPRGGCKLLTALCRMGRLLKETQKLCKVCTCFCGWRGKKEMKYKRVFANLSLGVLLLGINPNSFDMCCRNTKKVILQVSLNAHIHFEMCRSK